MEELFKLLERYKKAEKYFEDEKISLEAKEKQINNLKKLINNIDNEYVRLNLTQEQLKQAMIKIEILEG